MRKMRTVISDESGSFGTFLSLGPPLAAEACAVSGFEWLLIDLEHGGGDEMAMIGQIRAAGMHDVPCIVRVENVERIRSGRVLDLGARGVMFPRLSEVAEVVEAVRHLHFPPTGTRGVATYHPAGGFGLHPEWLDRADEEVICVIQIETLQALKNVEEIAAVPGVDVLFVGPRDMTSALGIPAAFHDTRHLEALDKVAAAALHNGIRAGILASNAADAERHRSSGFDFIAIASDAVLLASAGHRAPAEVRARTAGPLLPTTLG